MTKQLTFSQALIGYELAAQARHLSPHTLSDYQNTFRKFQDYLDDDPPIAEIMHTQIAGFLSIQEVSKKTILNYHTGLSALWTWAVDEDLVPDNIVHRVERSKPEKPAIVPLSQADVQAMLAALGRSRSYARPGKKESSHALPNPERNRAIILLLLDTGIRASELCGLHIHHVDMRNSRIVVENGKGDKGRPIPFSARTGQAIWRYLATRKDDAAGDFLFVTETGRPLDRTQLRKTLIKIGKRAGVSSAHPHRWRHTFAIEYLRNVKDPYGLQALLGHATMEMVKTYLKIAETDLEKNHKIGSPVDHWKL